MNFAIRALFLLNLGFFLTAAPAVYRIETIAGSSNVGDGGPALRAALHDAEGVVADKAGNLYIADAGDHRVRKVSPSGTITTIAGTGIPGFTGDGGPATLAQLNLPYGVSVDAAGNLYIADLGNGRIRRVSPAGLIVSLPGAFKAPRNVLADPKGNVYVSEFDGNRVRRIEAADGTITTIAGTGARGSSGDFAAASLATLNSPAGLALDRSGALYIADSGNSSIRRVGGGTITTVLGTGSAGASSAAQLNYPTGIGVDQTGNLYVADAENRRIRKLSVSGSVSTIAISARDVALDDAGNLFAAAAGTVTKLLVSGASTVIAGDGTYFYRGDSGPATEARLNLPSSVAISAAGIISIADTGNGKIRSISSGGIITTAATLRAPVALATDASGNSLVADPPAALIWKWSKGVLAAAAGNGFQSFTGEGYPALSSSLSLPSGVVAAPGGGFFVADTGNGRIRRVNAGGNLTTIAGTDRAGWNGDGVALGTMLDTPTALALDPAGTLYFADTGNHRIRKITAEGQVVTVAGGPDAPLALSFPRGLTFDPAGTLWISDTGHHRLLTLTPAGKLNVAAGLGTEGFSGDGAEAPAAQLSSPTGLAADTLGNILVADTGNGRIRKLTPPPAAPTEAPLTLYSVVNAATLAAGPVAPCSLLTVFGPDLGTQMLQFDSVSALPAASATGQASLQVPCSAQPPSVAFTIGDPSSPVWRYTLAVASAAPAVFALNAGTGQALALNTDATANSEANPAQRGSIVTLFVTGMGLPDNAAGVLIGNSTADLLYQGDAPGLLGITQLNIRLPLYAAGIQAVTVVSANIPSQPGVSIAIR